MDNRLKNYLDTAINDIKGFVNGEEENDFIQVRLQIYQNHESENPFENKLDAHMWLHINDENNVGNMSISLPTKVTLNSNLSASDIKEYYEIEPTQLISYFESLQEIEDVFLDYDDGNNGLLNITLLKSQEEIFEIKNYIRNELMETLHKNFNLHSLLSHDLNFNFDIIEEHQMCYPEQYDVQLNSNSLKP